MGMLNVDDSDGVLGHQRKLLLLDVMPGPTINSMLPAQAPLLSVRYGAVGGIHMAWSTHLRGSLLPRIFLFFACPFVEYRIFAIMISQKPMLWIPTYKQVSGIIRTVNASRASTVSIDSALLVQQ